MKKFLLIFLLFFLILLYLNPFVYFKRLWYPFRYKSLIKEYAERYNLDWRLVVSLIYYESGFDKDARSNSGACGLMQLLPETAREIGRRLWRRDIGEDELFKPRINLELGCFYLRKLLDRFDNNIELTLTAYNAGIGKVLNWMDRAGAGKVRYKDLTDYIYPETKRYVSKVKRLYRILKIVYPV